MTKRYGIIFFASAIILIASLVGYGIYTGQAATAVLDVLIALFYLILLYTYNPILSEIGFAFSAINVGILYFMFRWMTEQQMKIQQDGALK